MTELDPHQVERVGQAMAAGHRITTCEHCGGPEIHSLERPAAKCFRCFAYRTTEQVMSLPARRKCQRCKKFFRSRMEWLFCDYCREKRKKQGLGDRKVA